TARGTGLLGRPRPSTVAVPKRGKRLKFRAHDACSGRVTVADYAKSDLAVVRSGRVKKTVTNAVQQEVKSLCGLEASQVPAEECFLGLVSPVTSSTAVMRWMPRRKASMRELSPEKRKNAWSVTCTATFWTSLYRRHYPLDASLPLPLRPESMEKLHCLRACVSQSLYHMYEPFAARISKNPAIPESTPSALKNSKCLLF
ncbi:hypothetical protein H8959_020487, partial [Pygathrix nigripes]